MSIDKLKSIAERSERECAGFMGIDGLFVQHYLELRAALRVAIAQLEIYEGAIEFYGKVYNHDNCFRPDLGTYVLANTEGSSEIETDRGFRARQAKLEADEILKGVAE